MKQKAHGGDVYSASLLTGIPVGNIIDFSASINPLGASTMAMKAAYGSMANIRNYPPPYADRLSCQIAEQFGATHPAQVIAGNGSTELIYLLPRALKPGSVLIHEPAFSEYARAAMLAGAKVHRTVGLSFDFDRFVRAMRSLGPDMAFICNPNNPTGQLLDEEIVEKLAHEAKKARCHLVVDEAFIDFCPGRSLAERAAKGKNPWLIILRSMTKFHALTGFRMGYAVFGSAQTAKKVLGCKEPWSINIPAMEAAAAALDDAAHGEKTLSLIERERTYIAGQLNEAGAWHLPTAANFFLIKIAQADGLVKQLFEKGILIRDCSNFRGLGKGYIRFAIKKRKENRILLSAIRGYSKQVSTL